PLICTYGSEEINSDSEHSGSYLVSFALPFCDFHSPSSNFLFAKFCSSSGIEIS
ncbi:unnamed protein product, partial [Citrullus colocynthis]